MIRTTTGLTLPAALLLTLAAFFAFAALAGAEKVTTPSKGITPKSFGAGCLASNGELIEIEAPNGTITESSCSHGGKESSSCNWVKETCTDTVIEPTSGGDGRVPAGGVLVDDSPGANEPGFRFGDVAAPTGERAATDDQR